MTKGGRSVDLSRLSCSSICFREFPLREALEAIGALGFRQYDIGILGSFCPHFDLTRASRDDEKKLLRTIAASSMALYSFNANVGSYNDPEAGEAAIRQSGSRLLRLAKEAGARGVTVNCGKYRDRSEYPFAGDVEAAAESIRRLAEEVARLGLELSVEAPHKSSLVRTAAEAMELARLTGRDDVRLIFDGNHHAAAGWRMRDAIRMVGSRIAIVHLRDADGAENRYPLGSGRIDYAEMFDALDEAGFQGPLAFEFSESWGSVEANSAVIRASIDYLRKLRY